VTTVDRGSLRVLDIPFAFSQSPVLKSSQFIAQAKKWGYRLKLDQLEDLNFQGLLIPFFRVDDVRLPELEIPGDASDSSALAQYARAGQVRDPALEDRSNRRPYRRPKDQDNWWDGFYYGRWQLLGVANALKCRTNVEVWPDELPTYAADAARVRDEHLVISAVSDRFLPGILGRSTYSSTSERDAVLKARMDIGADSRLAATTFPSQQLQPVAEYMLLHAANMDPMSGWWDLIRHAGYDGWSRMSGSPLEAVWWRVGAELLLLAHEELAEAGSLSPLPDFSAPPRFHHPLLDRPGTPAQSISLERALARYGLSPHSRVLLVVEGETERSYIGALLDGMGLANSHLVRVVVQGTSSDWPWQLAATIVPRLGELRGGRRMLDSMPTALMIAMDPEGDWRTQADVDRKRALLQRRVSDDAAAQGATLSQDELDILVQARNWGEFTFELANFSDGELETAIQSVALAHRLLGTDSDVWKAQLRTAIEYVRNRKLDIKIVFERMRWPVLKTELANALVPVLVAKLDHDHEDPDHQHPPALKLVYDIRWTVQRLSGPGFTLETDEPPAASQNSPAS
jgi:hypothetical protein